MTADPAETLRRAAAMLREAAEVAHVSIDGGFVPWQVSRNDETQVWDDRDRLVASVEGVAESRYIALVDPVVGAKLADWLDAEAQAAETWDMTAESGLDRPGTHALRIARSILRETGGK